jgi:hypothetical protein
MPPVGFESTISMLERAKTVHVLDRAATVIGSCESVHLKVHGLCSLIHACGSLRPKELLLRK